MELSLQKPWFLFSFYEVVPEVEFGSPLCRRTMFIDDPETLKSMVRSMDDVNFKLEAVQIVMPGYMTGSNQWCMAPLRAILDAKVVESASRVRVFETDCGQRYTESVGPNHIDALSEFRVRFEIRNNRQTMDPR